MAERTWSIEQLQAEVTRYEREIRKADMTDATVESYVSRANRFISWLGGEWKPRRDEYQHVHK